MITNQTQKRMPLPHVQVAACPVCGEASFTIFRENAPVDMRFFSNLPDVFKVQKFMLVRCNKCSLVYLSNRPANDDLEVYYGSGYGANYKQTLLINLAHKVYDFIHYTRLKKHLLNAGGVQNNEITILDYGCGDAKRINNFRTFNSKWAFYACDKFLVRSENTNDAVHIFESEHSDIHLHMGTHSCDIITALSVIEHVESPLDMLRSFYPLLKNNGIVYLMFPVADCWEATLFDDLFLSFHVPCHFTMPCKQSISWMANEAGFTVKRYGNEMCSTASLWLQLESSIQKHFRLPKLLLDVLRLPLAASLLPLELIQSGRGKSLCEQYVVLQKR